MERVMPSDAEKAEVWRAYRERRAVRVPVVLSTNPRVVLLDPAWNVEGYTFEQAAHDPAAHVAVALKHELWRRTFAARYCDEPAALPEVWKVGLNVYNVYEAAYFGAAVDYSPGQVPDTVPPLADDAVKESVFEVDIERPLENAFVAGRLKFWAEMQRVCQGLRFEGRPVELTPWALCGSDGPVTVACNLRGADRFMLDLADDDGYADRLLGWIARAAINRRRAFEEYWGDRIGRGNGMADDSCALISIDLYRKRVLPHHRAFYDAAPGRARGMHMCGDATRLFATIHNELGVVSFDTGFPVDHGRLRDELGEAVDIQGGPEVALLLRGTPAAVYERTREILGSGVMRGGRFVLREANNLPPLVPGANLAAMYEACLEHGWHAAVAAPA